MTFEDRWQLNTLQFVIKLNVRVPKILHLMASGNLIEVVTKTGLTVLKLPFLLQVIKKCLLFNITEIVLKMQSRFYWIDLSSTISSFCVNHLFY